MRKGDLALIDCKKGYSQSSSEDLWSARWCHWSGSQMPAIYNKIRERGLKPVFHPADCGVFIELLEELYDTASSGSFVRDALINEILTRLVTELLEETIYDEVSVGVPAGIFWANNIAYYVISNNGGYTGNLETALVPEQFARGILHEKLNSNGVMAESTDVEVEHFGLLFESSGDVHKTRHVYICAVLLW